MKQGAHISLVHSTWCVPEHYTEYVYLDSELNVQVTAGFILLKEIL